MTFDSLMMNLGTNIGNEEQLGEAFDELWTLPKQSMTELAEELNRVMPGGYSIPEQQEERRALTEQMQEKMRNMAKNAFERNQTIQDSAPRASELPRHLQAIVVEPAAEKDSSKLFSIQRQLEYGSPEVRAQRVMKSLNAMAPKFEELRELHLNNMTDAQVMEHFETIYQMTQVTNQLRAACSDQNIALTQEQREKLYQLEEEFAGPLSGAYTRAKNIANPCYEMFPPQEFQNLTSNELADLADEFGIEKSGIAGNEPFFDYLVSDVASTRNFVSSGLTSQVTRSVLQEHPMEDVVWKNEEGKVIPRKDSVHQCLLEEEPFNDGKPLIAEFSDGTHKVFFDDMRGPHPRVVEGDNKLLASYGVKETSTNLLKEAKDADPFYLLSGSKQFKTMREDLENMARVCRHLDDPPTALQMLQMKNLSEKLEKSSQAYLNYKLDGKDPEFKGKNETERARIKAAQNIQRFAKQQSVRLKTAFQMDPLLETQAVLEEKNEFNQRFNGLSEFLLEQPMNGGPQNVTISQEAMEKFAQMADQKYPKQPGNPESALNRLNGYIKAEIRSMANPENGGFQIAAKRAAVLMTGYDLIAQEQNAHVGEGRGSLETMFDKDANKFVQTVGKSGAMQEHLKNPALPKQFEQFLNNNGGRKLAAQIIQQAKAPAQRTNSSAQPQMSQQRQTQPKVNAPKK